MRISERAIELPRLVILASILICAAGIAALITLPKERTPRIKLPVISVAVPNPGASPATNEAQIIRKIEDEAGALKNLRSEGAIFSQAVQGAAMVQFVFDDDVDVDQAKRDVESLINRIKGEFPLSAQRDPGPIVNDIGYESWPIIQVFVAGGSDGLQRRRIAERLQNRIETVQGVSAVDIFGGLEREVQIDVDPNLMTMYGFTYQQLEIAVRSANTEAPSGEIESASGNDQRVRNAGKLQSVEDIARIPLGVRDGKTVLLADVAEVGMGHKPVKTLARYDGQDAAVLLARAKTDINVLAAADQIQTIVNEFVAAGQGEDTRIGTVRSQAREIHYMLNQLSGNAFWGTVLVILMLWISFGWRNATLIAISFPFCILGTAAALWCAKTFINPDLAINNMTLFAIIVVVGEVADGAIIVGESIYRHRELGKSPIQAGKDGLREVGPALSSAYLTTIAGFAPLFLVRGIMGDFLELLPIVTILALIAAIAVAYFLLPVMSVYLMKPKALVTIVPRHADGRPMTDEEQEIAGVDALVAASPMKQVYGRIIGYALHHRLLVLTLSVVITLVPVGLFAVGAVGFELFPESDVPIIEVYFELPLGASMQNKTVAVAQRIEQAVMTAVRPEEWHRPSPTAERVRPVTTIGEPGALNIRLDAPMSTGPEFGMVYVELELAENRQRSAAEIRHAIAKAMPPMPGVVVRVTSPKEGPPSGAPVLLRVLAQDQTSLDTMAQHAARIEQLLASIPGVYDITNDYRVRPQLVVTPNREAAALFGVDAMHIASSVNYALEGVLVGDVDFGGDDDIDLRIRNRVGDRDQSSDLANLMLTGSNGRRVILDQVATIERGTATHVIERYDRRRVINIRCNLQEGVLPDDVKAAMVSALRPELTAIQQHAVVMARDTMVIAAGDEVTVEFGGENEIRDKAVADLQLAMAISMGLMLIILVVQFNSFIQPMIILFSVPLCLVGVAIGLMLWGLNFSIMSMIGIVALSGIVVDNAMVLVEFINKMRALGVPLEKAVVYAGQLRVRPLILTTLTNVVGMIPVSMNWSGGGEIWQPLAVTIMAGLAFATVVQLVIIPLAVYTFNRDSKVSWLDPMQRPEYSAAAPVPQ